MVKKDAAAVRRLRLRRHPDFREAGRRRPLGLRRPGREMTKTTKLAAAAAFCAMAAAGCSNMSAPALIQTETTFAMSDGQVRNAVVEALRADHWALCDAGGGVIRANRPIAEGGMLFIDAAVERSAFSLRPNVRYTTGAESGEVPDAANEAVIRLRGDVQARMNPKTDAEPVRLDRCVNYGSVAYAPHEDAGRAPALSGFAWVQKPEDPEDAVFAVRLAPNQASPQDGRSAAVLEALRERLDDADILGDEESPFVMEVSFPAPGVGLRVSGGQSDGGLSVRAAVKNRAGETVALVDAAVSLADIDEERALREAELAAAAVVDAAVEAFGTDSWLPF